MCKYSSNNFTETIQIRFVNGEPLVLGVPSSSARLIIDLGFVQNIILSCDMARLRTCGYTVVWYRNGYKGRLQIIQNNHD